jgi:hypothetical protein
MLSFNSKLRYFDKNLNLGLNLNHKWLSPTWRKSIWFSSMAEYVDIQSKSTVKDRFPQRIFSYARTILTIRDFGRF